MFRWDSFTVKNKIGVTNPKEFINPFLEYMTKNEILREDMIKGKKSILSQKNLDFHRTTRYTDKV